MPNAITTAGLLSSSYRKAGRHDDAIQLLRATLEVSRRKNGATHPATLVISNELAYSLDKSGKIDEAYPIYEQVAKDAGDRFGKDHPNTLTTELSVVSVLARKSDLKGALLNLNRIGPLFLRWTTAQLYETTETGGRQRLLARQSTYPDVAISLGLLDSTSAGVKLAANTILQWKQLQGAQDTLLTRFIATTRDTIVVDLAKRLAVLRNQLAIAYHRGAPAATRLLREVETAEARLAAVSKEFAEAQRLQQAGLEDVSAALEDKTGLLEFRLFRPVDIHDGLPGERRLLGMLLRPNEDPIVRDLGVHSEIERKVQAATSFDNATTRRTALQELSEQLLTPFQQELGSLQKVYVAPDGALNLLPIEMLPFGKARYWIEAQDLRFVSTGRVIAAVRERGPSGDLVAIGAVQFDDPTSIERQPSRNEVLISRTSGGATRLSELRPFKALSETGPEIASVADSWSRLIGSRATLLSGTTASESAIKALAQPPGVLHFATHGFFLANRQANEGSMLLSGLALAGANLAIRGSVDLEGEDGILWALEAMSLNLTGTKLIVMSACDTAQGILDAYEGVYGLSRAFQIAGAENVVVTLWTLNDSRARAFMEEFYRRWVDAGATGDPADALRATKLAWIESPNPERSDVRIWAPYMLMQRGR